MKLKKTLLATLILSCLVSSSFAAPKKPSPEPTPKPKPSPTPWPCNIIVCGPLAHPAVPKDL
ncbi:MAG: hypothetical protein WAQ53_15615 [Thiofilum sp.]|uniref:hypothetical protein n=1 Tax=Thiofilum sp. TaxID=2212733 RepID=UPI0025F465BC|nr:hypothetical protein [Thiofilum sp.]MBK8455434.1 hypothetical protein [Thiofilum sp.]